MDDTGKCPECGAPVNVTHVNRIGDPTRHRYHRCTACDWTDAPSNLFGTDETQTEPAPTSTTPKKPKTRGRTTMSRNGYARLSNEFWRSPTAMKMLAVNPAALGFYVAAVSYSSDNLTDGLIEESVARYVLRVPQDVIDYLVDEGKWEPVETGWLIHNYTKWQNSREQVETARERDRNRKANSRSGNTPDGFQTDSARIPRGIQTDLNVNQNQNQNQNQDSLTEGSSGGELTNRARVRVAAPTPAGEDVDEDALVESWRPSAENTALAEQLGVDAARLERRFRDKIARKGLTALGVKRRTLTALDATFRSWVEHEAQWAGEGPKQVKPPDPVHAAPHRHSWCGPEVRAIMRPYLAAFPEPDPDATGPDKAWFEACRDVARRLDDGEDEASIIEWAEANYGPQNPTSAANDP